MTHHYLIDLVAGGSLACAYFYYYLARMPDDLRHPTNTTPVYSNTAPGDVEAGSSIGTLNGNGYGGWDHHGSSDDLSEAYEEAQQRAALMRDNSVDLDAPGVVREFAKAGSKGVGRP